MMPAPPRTRTRSAFTLIELLVVISVIALLVGILLPALGAARGAAQVSACLSNSRQLALATNSYLADFKDVTPNAAYNNKAGLSPKGQGAAPGTLIGTGPNRVIPSIGEALSPYLSDIQPGQFWACPAADGVADNAFAIEGSDPYSGFAADDLFVPNYFYMQTYAWIDIPANSSWFPQVWSTRNAANVDLGKINVAPTELVLFVEESTSHHSGSEDIYTRAAAGRKATDTSNFAFADGHAATQRFDDLDGYLRSLHGKVVQTQPAGQWTSKPAWTSPLNFDKP
ncbi:type II secretion system protein [Phycisphaera mikurensis]|uniref:Prepilin-type N-terminal cleavage/methylation domain-containing protein n=1 Tax=Phycisphaera mikurensis (strain NBRC 102666 / KCTC 22515 / FYK2301M01) TaxID=1142394 RepID=I0IF26_PHYMF|nr:type II secretion system protein [Phycisphaera mikurensis]MBB6441655.1 prepilin-type N-terminal cleavage/methylation domain-containing protein/prepilin-type processing-associated H-X9-DG protein [Phycisphaera mikurensis]BAM03864.1 hypothetical protein PSMK_17050 [Phycisphaera mikurensis NBRC 102666]